jgi:DNA polymerase-3 subunit alpha
LDEWEFEVRELCNITAEELTRFEGWGKPEMRNNAAATSSEEEEETDTKTTPNEWLKSHADKTLHLGGIVVSAEELISQKGNPYGRYVIEDYSGSYKFSAFGETYKQYAALLKQNVYVYLSGVIQQKGAHFKYFKPKPMEEAEYEFALQHVQLIQDAQKNLQSVTLYLHIDAIQPDLIEEMAEIVQQHAGDTTLKLQIFDAIHQNIITLNAPSIKMDGEFYHWLKEKQMDDVLEYKMN